MVLNYKIQSTLFSSLKSFSTTTKLTLFSGFRLNKNSKEAAMMNKFIDRNKRKKKFYFNNPVFMPSLVEKQTTNHEDRRVPRRISVLNKLFINHITDIMVTGSSCTDFTDCRLIITRVSLSTDFRNLNVYWLSTNATVEDGIDNRLSEAGHMIRNELSKLNILANVPKIVFHKDKGQSALCLVEKLLSRADFQERNGDEFRIECNSSKTLPTMSSKILGLDREKIIQKVKSDLKKRKLNKIKN